MPTKIRLARGGSKKRPFYSIVVADVRAPRDGRFIEKLGTYNPLLPKEDANRLVLNKERIAFWIGNGATPTDRVESFLVGAGLFTRSKRKEKIVQDRISKGEALKAEKQKAEEAKEKEIAEAKAAEEAEAKAAEEKAAKQAEEQSKEAAEDTNSS